MGKVATYISESKNPRSGEKIYVRRTLPYSKMAKDDVVAYAQANSSVNPQDLAVAFDALGAAIEQFVLNGHSVTLDGLGNFRITSKSGVWDSNNNKWVSGGSDNMDDVTPEKIRGVFVRFRPSREVRTMLRKTQFFDCTKTKFGGTMGNYNYTEVTK